MSFSLRTYAFTHANILTQYEIDLDIEKYGDEQRSREVFGSFGTYCSLFPIST
jgi:hypothetical protein